MPEKDAPISKSQAIRAYLAEHPDASSMSVAEALTAQGIRVKPAHVSVVRTMLQPPKPVESEPETQPSQIHITITPPPERSTPWKKSPRKKPAAGGGTADVTAVLNAIVYRQGLRSGGKHGTGQVQNNSQPAEDPPV